MAAMCMDLSGLEMWPVIVFKWSGTKVVQPMSGYYARCEKGSHQSVSLSKETPTFSCSYKNTAQR